MSKAAALSKKRPCRICRRWFTANPRLGQRQMTCGSAQCKKEWHRKKCTEGNKKNSKCFKANYLQKKLDAIAQPVQDSNSLQPGSSGPAPPKGGLSTGLPLGQIQEVIGAKQLVIVEYLAGLLIRRFQEALRRAQFRANTG